MTTETKIPEGEAEDTALAPRPVRGDVISAYESMLSTVPDAGDQGIEGILEQIASATSAQELDDPWRAGGMAKYTDTELVVTGIRKMESDYGSGLAYFLVVDAAERETGERVTFTTGSLSVVAQLVKAWSLDAFPLAVIPRLSKRPTKDGFYPQHLEIVAK